MMLRKATLDDAEALGAVHVAAWRETYAGLLPEDLFASLSVEARVAMWAGMLRDPSAFAGTTVHVAEDEGSIIGFGAIYVLRAWQGRGVGRALMNGMAMDLRSRGCKAVALWVLRENAPARAFYHHLGGEVVMEKEDRRGAAILHEVAYGWRAPWKDAASPHSLLGAGARRG